MFEVADAHGFAAAPERSCGSWTAPDPVDPLSRDQLDDFPLVTSERRIVRLVTLAADVGARFANEGIREDAARWMLEPKRLFRGGRAVDACQDREEYVVATLFHLLRVREGAEIDADPLEVASWLWDDEDAEASDDHAAEIPVGVDGRFRVPTPRLFTSIIEGRMGSGGRTLQAFCATIACDEGTVRRRLAVRYGEELAASAVVEAGFDNHRAIARELVTEAMASEIEAAVIDPGGPIALGLDVRVERRIVA
jgi:hypothetical protein